MASKADLQALTIINTIIGAIRLMVREHRISHVNILRRLQAEEKEMMDMRKAWCELPPKQAKRMVDNIVAWGKETDKILVNDDFRSIMLIKIALFAATDLEAKLKNKWKKAQMCRAMEILEQIDDRFDPMKDAMVSAAAGETILQLLYKEIGFTQ